MTIRTIVNVFKTIPAPLKDLGMENMGINSERRSMSIPPIRNKSPPIISKPAKIVTPVGLPVTVEVDLGVGVTADWIGVPQLGQNLASSDDRLPQLEQNGI